MPIMRHWSDAVVGLMLEMPGSWPANKHRAGIQWFSQQTTNYQHMFSLYISASMNKGRNVEQWQWYITANCLDAESRFTRNIMWVHSAALLVNAYWVIQQRIQGLAVCQAVYVLWIFWWVVSLTANQWMTLISSPDQKAYLNLACTPFSNYAGYMRGSDLHYQNLLRKHLAFFMCREKEAAHFHAHVTFYTMPVV